MHVTVRIKNAMETAAETIYTSSAKDFFDLSDTIRYSVYAESAINTKINNKENNHAKNDELTCSMCLSVCIIIAQILK